LLREIDVSNPGPDFTQKWLSQFREPLPEDETQALLQDKLQSGWLAWGKTLEVSRLTGWEEQCWTIDPLSKDALNIIEGAMSAPGWWQKVAYCDHLAGTWS
jgi:proteasome activator subunit 4